MTKARDIASAIPAPSTVSSAELGYLDGVTSAIQTQIDTKAASSTAVTLTGTQTLTNKTLTSPALTTPTISTATTNGDLLYGTGSGALTRLGIGSSSQVLTVASGVPSWATPSSGGMTLLSTTTASGSSTSINITPTGYNALYINVFGMEPSSATEMYTLLNNDSTLNYSMAWLGRNGANSVITNTSGGVTSFRFSGGVNMGSGQTNNSYQIMIYDPNNTSSYPKNVTCSSTSFNASGLREVYWTIGSKITLGAISSIQFNTGGGNFNAGTIQIYGVK